MKPLLLVVDVTNGLTAAESPGNLFRENLAARDKMISNINELIEKFRAQKWPIVFIHVGFDENYEDCPKNSPTFNMLKNFGALKMGAWDTQFNRELNYTDSDIVLVKKGISAFCGTTLEQMIRTTDINEVILTGLATDKAIQLTAFELHDKDIPVTVVSDACAAANTETHEFSLRVLREGICRVRTAADYCSEVPQAAPQTLFAAAM